MNIDLANSKISYLDAAFIGTSESQGFKNAKNAIKLCLFNDMSVLQDHEIDYSKWLLISSKYDGRNKAKKIQLDDLAHILIKFSMANFGVKNKSFSVTEGMYMDHRQNPQLSLDLSREDATELLAFAAFQDIYSAYVFLLSNNNICNLVVDSLIENRYLNMLKEEYDNYDGKINDPSVSNEFQYMFYIRYNKIDEEMANIKLDDDYYTKD